MNQRTKRAALVLGSMRERGTIVLVAALCGAYATVLLLGAGSLVRLTNGDRSTLGVFLGLLSGVFVGIALYVASVVIAGSTATVISGREQQIATLRLLGADARMLRRTVAVGCAQASGVGALVGIAGGHLIAWIGRGYLVAHGTFPHRRYPTTDWRILLAFVAIVVCGLLAGQIGTRRVLSVNPASAMGSATTSERRTAGRRRAAFTLITLTVGAALMLLACWLAEHGSTSGLLCAFFGCTIFTSGVLAGAPFIIPSAVALIGRGLGDDTSARIARRNAVADPMRTSRSTLGLVIGSELITTILAGTDAVRHSIPRWGLSADHERIARELLSMMATLMTYIIAISSLIAAVGFVSTMTLVVIQRRRELGLLRAMGLTGRDVTRMITKESLALGLTAVLLGMGLGVLFGSVAAQSLLGGLSDGFVWGIPTTALAVITSCGLMLVLVAALPPARRATRVTPVEALRTA